MDAKHKVDEIFEIIPAELGGGGMEWIRFTIDIKCYFSLSSESRDTARRIALWVFGRVKQAIRENRGLWVNPTLPLPGGCVCSGYTGAIPRCLHSARDGFASFRIDPALHAGIQFRESDAPGAIVGQITRQALCESYRVAALQAPVRGIQDKPQPWRAVGA